MAYAVWYINPGLGSGSNNGTSWANAFKSATTAWTDAIAASAAGDDFAVNAASSCANTTAQTLTFKGTLTSPNRVFSFSGLTHGTSTSLPPATDLGAGAAISVTGTSTGLNVNGYVYFYGLAITWGASGNNGNAFNPLSAVVPGEQEWVNCTFTCNGDSYNDYACIGNGYDTSKLTFTNCTWTFNNGATYPCFVLIGTPVKFVNNTITATTGSTLCQPYATSVYAVNSITTFDGCNLVGFASGASLGSSFWAGVLRFINCELGASVALPSTPTQPAAVAYLVACGNGSSVEQQAIVAYQGTLQQSTSVYNRASDGTTAFSWQIATNANNKPQSPFECFEIVQWAAAGTHAASYVQITSATAGLTNADVWVDVQYLSSGSYPITSLISSAAATMLTAGTGLSPAGTWAVGGAGTNYELAIPSFTTAIPGLVRLTVKIAKPSITVYVDPAAVIA